MIQIGNYKIASQNDQNIEPVIIEEVSIMSTKKEKVDTDIEGNFAIPKNTHVTLSDNEMSQAVEEELRGENNIPENLNTECEIILNNTLLKQDDESDDESVDIEYHSPSNSPGYLDEAFIKSETEEGSNEPSAQGLGFAENNIEKGSVLIVNLHRSTKCEEKYYQKLLGTREKLFVYLRRENLHELQKNYDENPCNTTGKRKSKSCSKRTTFRCKVCRFKSNAKCNLLVHIVDSHKEFAAEKKLPSAQCITPGEDPGTVWYKCIDCSYITMWKSDFNKHLFIHKSPQDGDETFSCATCSYVTIERRQLVKHMARHSKMVCQCPHCDFQTHVRAYLKYHIKNMHKSEKFKIFKCTACSFQTKYKYGLKKHMVTHSNTRKLYKCPLCPFETHLLRTIKITHPLVHKSDEETKIHKCEVCPFKSKTICDLRKHTLVHKSPDEVPMFKCTVCSFQTKYRSYLKRHTQNHQVPEDGKGFQCNLCDYQGKWAVNLRVHFRNVHRKPNEGKMHKCTQCPYQSRYSVVFKKHLLQHIPIEERTSFPCDSCDFHSTSKEGLKVHWNNMHRKPEEMEKFICAKCDFQTKQKYNLKSHIMRQHKKSSKQIKSVTTNSRCLQEHK